MEFVLLCRFWNIATNDIIRLEALRGEKDLEGRPCDHDGLYSNVIQNEG